MPALSESRLMRESEQCLQDAARTGDERQQLVAERILGSVNLWCRWEVEHKALVRGVASFTGTDAQSIALRSAGLGLIHRKALFEYLRTNHLRDAARRRVICYFRGSLQYSDAVISEHGHYLRSAGSHLCAHHLGVAVLMDGTFQSPVARYEELYTEYFQAFCENLIGVDAEAAAQQRSMLPLLKHEVTRLHASILTLPRTKVDLDYEALLRRPTGDTQRLKRPRTHHSDFARR
jgi:hypothetical protein